MADQPALHIEGGTCWCADAAQKINVFDRLYPDRCRAADDRGDQLCVLAAGHDVPCHFIHERPGTPCHFCGAIVPIELGDTGSYAGCASCWVDVTSMAPADVKALFARAWPEVNVESDGTLGVASERGGGQ